MLVRAMAQLPTPQSDPLPYVSKAFETVALAKVSASGPDAQRLGYLAATDSFTMNRERLMADAKAKALQRVREGITYLRRGRRYQSAANRSPRRSTSACT